MSTRTGLTIEHGCTGRSAPTATTVAASMAPTTSGMAGGIPPSQTGTQLTASPIASDVPTYQAADTARHDEPLGVRSFWPSRPDVRLMDGE